MMAAYIIPILALVSPLCRGKDTIAEIAGIPQTEEEIRNKQVEAKQAFVERTFARFTNAVIAVDSPCSIRTMYRLARVGADKWKTVASVDIDLKRRIFNGYLNALAYAARGFACFEGLRYENTILIAIPNGCPDKVVRLATEDGRNETIEFWQGWRRYIPDDSFYGTLCDVSLLPDNFGIESYFSWPTLKEKPQQRGIRGIQLFSLSLLVARDTIEGNGIHSELWDFSYRLPPTLEELRKELREVMESIKEKRSANSISAPLKTY